MDQKKRRMMGEKESSVQVNPIAIRPESVINLMPPPHIKPVTYDHKHVLNNGGSGGVGRRIGELRLEGVVLKQESHSYPLQSPPGFTALPFPSSLVPDSPKRRRGRPIGSRNRPKVPTAGEWLERTEGEGFTPYLMTVQTGQDVVAALSSFHVDGAQTVCVLCATGSVSSVTLKRYQIMSVTIEGEFQILSLTGFFVANDPTRLILGNELAISISDTHGSVSGGAVAGPIVAANPIQVVLGCFTPKAPNKLLQKSKYTEQTPTPTATMGRPSCGGFVDPTPTATMGRPSCGGFVDPTPTATMGRPSCGGFVDPTPTATMGHPSCGGFVDPTPTATMGRPSCGGFVDLLQSQQMWAETTTFGAHMKSGSPVGPLDEINRDDAIKDVSNIQNLNLEPTVNDHGERNDSGPDQTPSQYCSSREKGQAFISSCLEDLFGI